MKAMKVLTWEPLETSLSRRPGTTN